MANTNATPNVDPSAGMTFDTAPVSQATPASALSVSSTNGNSNTATQAPDAGAGMTFDAKPVAAPLTVRNGQPIATIKATPGSMPGDSLPSKITLWADNLKNDLMHGTETTDIGKLYKSIGGQPLAAGQGVGVGEFMGSPILGPLRVLKGQSEIPQSGRRWQGVKDTVGGTLDALQIPGSFVSPEAGELAGQVADGRAISAARDVASTVGSELADQAGRAAKAVANAPSALKNATSVKALQPKLQGAITSAIQDAAAEHGVTIPTETNVRDVTQALSSALRSKAHGLYQQLDNALGGTRFQSFEEAIDNVQQAIRDEAGLDPDRDKLLSKRLADAKAARDAAIETAQANGVDPATIDQADALHRKAMALQDVSKAVRASTDVHPSQVAEGASNTAATNVRTKPLFNRIQALATPNPKYPGSPSRLVQAIGEQRAAELLNAVDEAHLTAQKILARNATIKRWAGRAGLTGLGAYGYHGIHDLLGHE